MLLVFIVLLVQLNHFLFIIFQLPLQVLLAFPCLINDVLLFLYDALALVLFLVKFV